tara:strand:- start:2096 stop:3850 length:1755 start_codon:yes stop_codon:yes gene_type:complete
MTNLSDIKSAVANAAGIGTTVYNSVSALPSTGLTSGDQAFVESAGAAGQSRLYISNGSGWYNVALINATPRLTLSSEGTIALASDGTATTITMTALDSDNASANLTLSIESGGDLFKFATVSQDSSVVTITPRSEDSAVALGSDGSATLTFKATDGISIGSVVNTFTLSFGPDWSQSPTQTKVIASDGGANDYFGASARVSKDGQYAIVGATTEDYDAGNSRANCGAAYIYVKSGGSWSQQAKLQASDAAASDEFGSDVALSEDGTYAVVGAKYGGTGSGNDNHGSAYIFIRSGTTWTQQQEINAGDPQEGAQFGYSVDINADGTYVAIGAPYWNSSNYGAAYVFTRSGTTWSQQQRLQSTAPSTNDNMGNSTRISDNGDYVIATAPYEDTGSTDAGLVYVFNRSGTTWSIQDTFQNSDTQLEDRLGFGSDISGDGNYIIVGSSWEDGGSGNPIDRAGAAYIFLRTGTSWAQQAKLVASDAGATDSFGYSCSISTDGSFALVSAHLEDGGAGDPKIFHGAAYVFSRDGTTWTQVRKLDAGGLLDARDYLGQSVAISGDGSVAFVSARGDDENGSEAGAAYFFEA